MATLQDLKVSGKPQQIASGSINASPGKIKIHHKKRLSQHPELLQLICCANSQRLIIRVTLQHSALLSELPLLVDA
jgi:hypothetical protein